MNTQTELTDRNLCVVRLRFLDLLISFFQEEPDAERISHWRGIFTALSRERINPQLDTSVLALSKLLDSKSLEELQEEFYTLFTNPYSKTLLPLNASYYLDGKSYGPSLATYREFLKEAKIIKDTAVTDPEDSLLLMLDALRTLVEEEKKGDTKARELQDRLIKQFIQPVAGKIDKRITGYKDAEFYRQCVGFLNGYLDLEQGLVTNG